MKAVLIDVYPLVRVVLRELLEHSYPDVQVQDEGSLAGLDSTSLEAADLLVFDLTGTESVQVDKVLEAQRRLPGLKKLFFVDRSFKQVIEQIATGNGLVMYKDSSYSSIIAALREYDPSSRSTPQSLLRHNEFQSEVHYPGADKPLTKNQVQAMECLCQGMTAKEVARAMGVGYDTARAHIKGAYLRLLAKNQAQAVSNFKLAKDMANRMQEV